MTRDAAQPAPDARAVLWPPPRVAEARPGRLVLGTPAWAVDAAFGPAFEHVLATARRSVERAFGAPVSSANATPIRLQRSPALARQGYTLEVGPRGVEVRASDDAGMRHALASLAQLVRAARAAAGPGAAATIPGAFLDDAPAFAERGVLLDVSRTKVPSIATLEATVERLAALKVNRLQLYFEHVFAYRGHADVWRAASAYTADEMAAFDRHCAAHGIELVPNQQSFGHLHRWLVHERYRPLAEVPEGVEHAFSIHKEPFALCPLDPGSFALLEDLYDQLLPCFASGTLNVGLDETFDLGLGRSKEECARRGKHRVYLEFLERVHGLLRARGRRMQFWGDIVVEAPEIVPLLPRDSVPLLWGYERGHPFEAHARLFAESGLEFHVCPGTASWQSLLGRVDTMLENVHSAARAGSAFGARGLLVTDWGDRGHLQPWSASWPGLVTAAGAAWNPAASEARLAGGGAELGELLDRHVFDAPDARLGAVLLELGRAGEASGARSTNGSPLFFLLAFAPQGLPHPRVTELTLAGLERAHAHLERARAALGRSRPASADGAVTLAELDWAARLAQFACRFGAARVAADGAARPAPVGADLARVAPAARAALHAELEARIAEYEPLWMDRNRPGGFTESRAWLERVLALLAGTHPSA